MKNFEISKELIEMGERDQAWRKEQIKTGQWEKNKKAGLALDRANTKRLKIIVSKIGLPTISKVGKKGSLYAWLIAQHTQDNNFRDEYLALMKKHLDDIKPSHMALMQDRVNMVQGKPQIYGTQFQKAPDGYYVLWKVRDRKNLDARRQKIGLEPFAKYIKAIAKNYKAKFKE